MLRLLLQVENPAALFHAPALVRMLQASGIEVGIRRGDSLFSQEAVAALTGMPPAEREEGFDAALSPYAPYSGSLPQIGPLPADGTASPERCLEAVLTHLSRQDLAGHTIMLTAGPTIEDADPARYVSNRSTGRMGTAIARMAARRGARVILVHGPMAASVPEHWRIEPVPVRSASQMLEAVDARLAEADVAVLCAAVADFSPLAYSEEKLKKGTSPCFTLKMKRNPDILAHIGACNPHPFLVGFAAESSNIAANAREKLERKNCDMLCANDITAPGCGFAGDTNSLTVFIRGGETQVIPLASKEHVADRLLDLIAERL